MEQRSFAEVEGFRRQEKVTRRERFLEEMELAMPWERFLAVIRPVYTLWRATGAGLILWRRCCGYT